MQSKSLGSIFTEGDYMSCEPSLQPNCQLPTASWQLVRPLKALSSFLSFMTHMQRLLALCLNLLIVVSVLANETVVARHWR